MAFLKIGTTDFSDICSGLKVGYETLVADTSARNANGDMTIDITAKKIKLYVTLRHTTDNEMSNFLKAIQNYVIEVTYRDSKTKALKTITCYTGTPEAEYFTISDRTLYKPMQLNFIEL